MPRSSTSMIAGLFMLAGLSITTPAYASGGGGGGGGGAGGGFGAPSDSAERIDPVQAYRQGVSLYRQGEYRKAERLLKDGAREARRDSDMHYALGLAQAAQEKWKPAARSFGKAVRYNPELHNARAQWGIALLNRNKPEDAAEQMAEFETRLSACGDTCDSQLVAAADKLRRAMNGEATDTVTISELPYLTLAQGDMAYLDAVRLVNLERYDEAKAELFKAKAAFGPHPDVLTYLGFTHRKSGDYDTAIAYYSAALEINPDHVGANEYLGEYYVELGQMDKAEAQLTRLEDICTFGCAEVDELSRWIADAQS